MPPLKKRIRVVFDTNVIAGYYRRRASDGVNTRVYRLWRHRRELQLIVSDEVAAEYYEILERLQVESTRIESFRQRLEERLIVTHVTPGPRPKVSRDADDDAMIAAAIAGKAEFLITNDHDLLDIAPQRKRKYKFEIVTPAQLLAQMP